MITPCNNLLLFAAIHSQKTKEKGFEVKGAFLNRTLLTAGLNSRTELGTLLNAVRQNLTNLEVCDNGYLNRSA
jgi:hypothetical protein